MSDAKNNLEIVVVLDHPHGKVEIPLEEWIAKGPGERKLLTPIAAKNRRTGKQVPLSVVPLRYRNNKLSSSLSERTYRPSA